MTNLKKEILVQGTGLLACVSTGFTIGYGTALCGAVAWATGHKVTGIMMICTGQVMGYKKGVDAYTWASNKMAELVDLDYWWMLANDDKEENTKEESTEEEVEEC